MLSDSIRFISNNVKGIQSFEKRIKIFEYLKKAIASCGFSTCCEVSNKKQDESGRILILDVKVGENDFLLINLHNANEQSEQLNTLSTLCNLLDDITDLHCKNIILGEDFNIFFNLTYEACGRNPKMKNKSVAKSIHIKESLELSDIWRVKIAKKKL